MIMNISTQEPNTSLAKSKDKVLLIHSYALLREGLASILRDAGFDVVSQGNSISDAVALINKHGCDLLLVDACLHDFNRDTIEDISERIHGAIVVLAQMPVPDDVKEIASSCTRGCLSLNLPMEDFIDAIRLINKGSMIFSPDTLDYCRPKWNETAKDVLSERERQVIKLIGEGASNHEIAETLIISEHTVKAHLRSTLNKLNLRNRQQMAAYAVRYKIATIADANEYADTLL